MESPQAIRARLKAVKNIGQITKAMEVVAATKMRKAQEVALNSRPYALKALEILAYINQNLPDGRQASPRATTDEVRAIKTTLVIVVSSDRGLAGPFNTQVFRAAEQFFLRDSKKSDPEHRYSLFAIGKKSVQFAGKKPYRIEGKFTGFGDYADPEEVMPAADLVIKGYEEGRWDRVVAISTHFRTTLNQVPIARQVLPVDFEKIRETVEELIPEHGKYAGVKREEVLTIDKDADYIFEPTRAEALAVLIPHLITMQLYHLVLEANASEHSARRVAMKTASDNADELSGKLTLEYNKSRQASITKEIIEITSTQSALG